jgi:hypothetical protein
MIIRDKYNIIVQQPDMDGGDSAFTTGIMAFSGSELDFELMQEFITLDNRLMRHPYQTTSTGDASHNDPASISRDQVISFYSGLFGKEYANLYLLLSCSKYADSWFVNRDFLSPMYRVYLYKLAELKAPLYLYPLAYLNLTLHLLWTRFTDHEMNQTVLTCVVYGKPWLKVLKLVHKDLYGNIREYFGGWRSKPEIGELFIAKIEKLLHE